MQKQQYYYSLFSQFINFKVKRFSMETSIRQEIKMNVKFLKEIWQIRTLHKDGSASLNVFMLYVSKKENE